MKRQGQAGLTLIELLVVMLLTLILTAGLYAMTAGQSRTYSNQLAGLNAQQNIWGAMEYLQRQIRLAGFGFAGCPNGIVSKADVSKTGLVSSMISGFQGFNDCSLDTYVRGGNTFPPAPLTCTGNGVDSFAIGYSTKAMNGQLSSVRLGDKNCNRIFDGVNLLAKACDGVTDNDILLMWEPGSSNPCSILQATKTSKPGPKNCKIQVNPSSPYNPPAPFKVLPSYDPCSTLLVNIGQLEDPLKFSIDNSTPGKPPRLVQWRKADRSDLETIADGIEDMQVSWACDTNKNGVLEEGANVVARLNDEWAANATGADIDPCHLPLGCVGAACTENLPVRAVRLTLIGRPASVELGNNTGFRPPAEDRPAGTVADDRTASGGVGTFRRVVLTSTVKLRNIR